jgi:hypothetical protein
LIEKDEPLSFLLFFFTNMKSDYEPMLDHGVGDNSVVVSAVAAGKFCSFGLVASKNWFTCFVIVVDGILKIYDSESTYRNQPQNHVLLINLSRNHRASEIKRKNYSQDHSRIIEFYCFYIEVENGVFPPTRQFKLGFTNRSVAENVQKAINLNSKGSI